MTDEQQAIPYDEEQWVIIYGTFADGCETVLGRFRTEVEAEAYAASRADLDAGEWVVRKVFNVHEPRKDQS